MDNATIKSGSIIQGSLICDNVVIEEKCQIKDCIIGSGKRVESQGKSIEVFV